jgi:hypothetical protein
MHLPDTDLGVATHCPWGKFCLLLQIPYRKTLHCSSATPAVARIGGGGLIWVWVNEVQPLPAIEVIRVVLGGGAA